GLCQLGFSASLPELANLIGALWLGHALGALVVAAPLLVLLTPPLLQWGLAVPEASEPSRGEMVAPWTTGEAIELAGLGLAAGLLGAVLAVVQVRDATHSWPLWGVLLLVVVWTCLRQGPRGMVVASTASICGLETARWLVDRGMPLLQGNFLAQ